MDKGALHLGLHPYVTALSGTGKRLRGPAYLRISGR